MPTSTWEELVAIALLGTDRRAVRLQAGNEPLAILLSQITTTNREPAAVLLDAAAVLAAYQRAGWVPNTIQGQRSITHAESDERPVCTERASQHLAAILSGTQRDLLPEWLELLAHAGRRIPASLLPEVLEVGKNQPELRPHIRLVLGRRGEWLAQQNPAWQYAIHVDASAAQDWNRLVAQWETGTRQLRLAMLTALRDTQPHQARELLASTWTSEKADDRAAFIGSLTTGLSPADEPFLEAALDDRSKEVRALAVQLLCQLPTSHLIQRMIMRVTPLLEWAGAAPASLLKLQRGRPSSITLNLPEACDKAMARDGVDPKPVMQHQQLGVKAQWILQMLRTIPPQYWCDTWQATPSEILEAASRSEWRKLLEAAWISATQTTGDKTWATALLTSDPSINSLFPILPPEQQEPILLAHLRDTTQPLTKNPALSLLQQTTHQWSTELTRAVLRALRQHMNNYQNHHDYQLLHAFDGFARRIPPTLVQEVSATWPASEQIREHWLGAVQRMLITLQFRHDMALELDC